MTRRPIFIGVATILALALTAGLAYGAGRMVPTRTHANQVGRQGPQVVAAAPGFYTGNMNGHFTGPGTAFRSQMHTWMRDRLQSWLGHGAFGGNQWAAPNRNHGRVGSVNGGTSYRAVGSNYTGNGYQHHAYHHTDRHMGPRSGSGGHQGGCCGW